MDIRLLSEYVQEVADDRKIRFSDDAIVSLNDAVNDALRDLIQVAMEIQKSCRRSVLRFDDLYRAIPICGFDEGLPCPDLCMIPERRRERTNERRKDTVIIPLNACMNQPIESVPVLSYRFSLRWTVIDGNKLLHSSPSLSNSSFDYFRVVFKRSCDNGEDAKLSYLWDYLETNPSVLSFAGEFSDYLSNEILSTLRVKPVTMATDLFRFIRTLFALVSNDTFDILLFYASILPPTLSCLLASQLSFYEEENHWRIRNMAAHCLITIYDKSRRSNGTCHESLLRTVLFQLNSSSASVGTVYGALHFIHLVGLPAIEKYLPIKYFSHFGPNHAFCKMKKNAFIRRELVEMLHAYLHRPSDCFPEGQPPKRLEEEYALLCRGTSAFSSILYPSLLV